MGNARVLMLERSSFVSNLTSTPFLYVCLLFRECFALCNQVLLFAYFKCHNVLLVRPDMGVRLNMLNHRFKLGDISQTEGS